MNWDDLRYILALARHATILESARALQVNPTTVSRRMRQLEADSGVTLFEKLKHGVVLTEAGEDMVSVAESVERLAHDLDARINGRNTKLEGTIRVTSLDPLLKHWMADFKTFQHRYPDITLDLTSGTSLLNLTQREADVAIRIATQAPDHLIGSRYTEVMHAIYGSPALIESIGADAPYEAFPWVSYDLSVFRGIDAWLQQNAPTARVVMRVGRIQTLIHALEAGVGLCILQCVAGDRNPMLRRVGPHLAGGTHLWMLTHPQLRSAARVSVFMAFVRTLIARDRDLFEGRCPREAAAP